MTRTELEKIIEFIEENSYHHAEGQYQLPYPHNAYYAANQPSGKRWSCAMRPYEISNAVWDEFSKTSTDDDC